MPTQPEGEQGPPPAGRAVLLRVSQSLVIPATCRPCALTFPVAYPLPTSSPKSWLRSHPWGVTTF